MLKMKEWYDHTTKLYSTKGDIRYGIEFYHTNLITEYDTWQPMGDHQKIHSGRMVEYLKITSGRDFKIDIHGNIRRFS